MTDPLVLTEQRDQLLIVTINRPKVHNALNPATNFELARIFDEFENDEDLWVAILTGAGDKAFCAGGDISEMVGAKTKEDYPIPDSGYAGLVNRHSCDKPIIAAVNGIAFGGGFEAALACDLVVASENASFGLPEPKIGTAAVAGGVHRLVRDIGLKPAMEILLTAEPVSAQQALQLGLVNRVVASEQVLPASIQLAEQILACAPLAVRATKHCAMQGLDHGSTRAALSAQMAGEFPALETMLQSEDLQEGLTAFLEKRQPKWRAK